MPIIVAQSAGFCMGVQRAVDGALQAARQAADGGIACYTLGELIHNNSVIADLAQQGIHAVEDPRQARGAALVIRSHGVSAAQWADCLVNAHQIKDCTCPFVAKVHDMVDSFSKDGAAVIIVGDAGHPEVHGTAGWCHGPAYIVSTPEDVAALPPLDGPVLAVCQTTFHPDLWAAAARRLQERYAQIELKNTICRATQQRQEEAVRLARQADCMIVVGSRHSSNTVKLYQSCADVCSRTILVECAQDIPPHFCRPDHENVGITAGASTPKRLLKEVIDQMNDMQQEQLQPQEQALAPQTDTQQDTGCALEPYMAEAMAQQQPTQQEQKQASAQPEQQPAAAPKETSFMDEVAANMVRIHNGQTLTGRVVQVDDEGVSVNIGYKSDGLVKRADLADEDVKVGDEIEVEVVKVNDGEGNVILSQRNIVNRKVWDDIMQKYEAGEFVDAVGKEAVKGGLLATISGVRAFIPASHLAQRYVDKITQFVGQPMKLKIIEVDAAKKRVVASRKDVLAAENANKKESAWGKLEEGATVQGIVRRFAPFGAFVDLGGVDGLIHVSDLSWNRSAQPQDVLKINQEVEVKILSLDRERERIQLGYKQLQPKPWDNIEEKYPVGTVLTRKVVRIRPFGAFVELEPGVDGLVHISQVALNRVNKVEDVLTPDQEVNVKVLAVDPEAKRISLSIREALEDGAFDYSQEIPGNDGAAQEYQPTEEELQRREEVVVSPETPGGVEHQVADEQKADNPEE